MKKIFAVFFASLLLHVVAVAQVVNVLGSSIPAPTLAAKSWLLLDATSKQVLASFNPNERVQPASLTKVMTEYLTFAALRDKRLSLDQMVNVPVEAWKIDPSSSKMFLVPNTQVSIKDLLYGLVVQSGNDAAVTLAYAVSGDAGAFVALMNQEAKKMGLNDTHYMNPHGLPKPEHYTTARDLSILAEHLVNDFSEYYKQFDSTKNFTYNKIIQSNRNRLLWLDSTVDGMKTGHTESAGYCLMSSAIRPSANGLNRRLIAVVMGTATDQERSSESLKLLNWGFQNFDDVKLYDANQAVATPAVWKGSRSSVPIGFIRQEIITVPKGGAGQLRTELIRKDLLIAPLPKGSPAGVLKIMMGNNPKPVAELPLVTLEPVNTASIFWRAWDSLRLMFK